MTCSGPADLDRSYRSIPPYSSGKHDLDLFVVDGEAGAVEGTFSGVLRDGQQVQLRFADFFPMKDGRMVARRTYFDTPAV